MVRWIGWVALVWFVGPADGFAKPTRSLTRGWWRKARKLQKSRRCPWKKQRGQLSPLCRRRRLAKKPGELFLVVRARSQVMFLCRGERLLKRFPIGHGRRGFGKQREGDKKTPYGRYRISWMAARHEPKRKSPKERVLQRFQIRHRQAYCKHNPKTNVSEFRRDKGPRGERLWMRPYGGRYAAVMALNYPNKADQKAGRTGSCIEIHASYHLKGSAGCLTLLPHQMIALYNCMQPGTRVDILR